MKNVSKKSITSFLDMTALIISFVNFVGWTLVVCTVGFLILNGLYEGRAIEENEFKLLMKNLDLAGCQESRNELIKKVNSGKAVTNGDASSSRSECEKELKQIANKAQ